MFVKPSTTQGENEADEALLMRLIGLEQGSGRGIWEWIWDEVDREGLRVQREAFHG